MDGEDVVHIDNGTFAQLYKNETPLAVTWRKLDVTPSQKPALDKPSTTLGEPENSGSLRCWAQRS